MKFQVDRDCFLRGETSAEMRQESGIRRSKKQKKEQSIRNNNRMCALDTQTQLFCKEILDQ